MFLTIYGLLIFVALTSAVPPQYHRQRADEEPKCGYESCHETKDGFVNVHIVPHTHDDVGWLKTVDQYFYGSKTYIQNAGVQYILDSVVDSLRKNPNRRFIYVETAFLWKWWMQQHDTVKHQFKRFVRNGQLEIIGGGWTMNDEAATHYQSTIDQFTWGLRKLNDTFGKCGRPKIGWQIDPFGHSREMASIFAQLGFDGLLLGRIDYEDRHFRFKTKTPEFVWKSSDNLGPKSELFTSIMYNTYSPPPGFCFDILCGDEPIIDDKRSPDYNVQKRVNDFLEYVKNMTKVYATSNMIVTMGNDFNYQDANVWFKNLDKLIKHANELQANGSKYHLLYSTPSCYLKAVRDEAAKNQLKWMVKSDDFFPYASDPHAYWTGYFTSRPTLKRFERMGNNFLQVCKQLYALTDLGPEDWADLNALREAMGIMQHHDAITGTEKQHVAYDYARILSRGFDECGFASATALSKIVTRSSEAATDPAPEIPFTSCLLSNISQCEFSESSENFVVTVYNPLSRPVSNYVRLPVTGKSYTVNDPEGNKIPTQIVPIPDPVLKIPGRQSSATTELVFLALNIPPLGFKSYYLAKSDHEEPSSNRISYKDVAIKIDNNTGLLYEISMNGRDIPIQQNFFFYKGATGNNEEYKARASGAYIFRPNGTDAYAISKKAEVKLYNGKIVTEIHQTFNEWASQIIKIYNNENYVEFDWLVGPIPMDDHIGKEVITRYSTNLKSDGTFYTDSNGREILKRVRNFRPTWKMSVTEPISGNYYPVTSKILVRDPNQDLEVAVLVDRAHGGTSLNDGELELMLHRRCMHDDAFGVGEALNETAFGKGLVVRGSHYLVAGSYLTNKYDKTIAAQERDIAQRKLLAAWTFLSPTNKLPFDEYKTKYVMKYSGLKTALPDNVQILTLEPWKGMYFLLRLEHVLEANEDPNLSKTVTVDLKNLFAPFEIIEYRETTLGANQWLEENERLEFETDGTLENLVNEYPFEEMGEYSPHWEDGLERWIHNQSDSNDVYAYRQFLNNKIETELEADDFKIVLSPMQIRTFIIDVKKTGL